MVREVGLPSTLRSWCSGSAAPAAESPAAGAIAAATRAPAAAPLPTPFKIYSLCLFPAELVPFSTYAGIAVVFGDTTTRRNPDGTTTTAQLITPASGLPAEHVKYEVWYNQTALTYKWYANAGADALGKYADSKSASATSRTKDTSLMLLVQRAVDEAVLASVLAGCGQAMQHARGAPHSLLTHLHILLKFTRGNRHISRVILMS